MGVEGGRGDGGCEEMMTRAVWLKRRCNRGGGARGVAGQQSKGPHHQHDHSADSSGVTELERGPAVVGREGGGERAAAAVQAHRIDPRCKACLPGFCLLSTGAQAARRDARSTDAFTSSSGSSGSAGSTRPSEQPSKPAHARGVAGPHRVIARPDQRRRGGSSGGGNIDNGVNGGGEGGGPWRASGDGDG